jgi:ligand-binding sensor domain-containing protein
MSVGRSCHIFIASLLLLINVEHSSAQTKLFDQVIINEESGLAQDFVYSIVQDKKGFIWFSTGKGLSRYDGRQVDNFNDRQGLPDNFVTASALLSSGRLLFGHSTGRLSTYNGVFFESLSIDTLKNEIVSLTEDENHDIWCATKSGGLLKLNRNLTLKSFMFPGELQGKIVNDIVILSGRLIAATNEGLYTFQISGNELFFIDSPDVLRYKEITALELVKTDSSGYWIGSSEGVIHRAKTGSSTRILVSIVTSGLESPIQDIVEASDKSLWIGTLQHGIYHLKLDGNYKIKESVVLNENNGYPIREAKTVFLDSQDNVWIGTSGNGVMEIYPKYIQFLNLKEWGVEKVYAIEEGIRDYYIATDAGMLTLSTDSTRSKKISKFSKLQSGPILCVFRSDNDLLWIGTENKGIYTYSETTGQLKRIALNTVDEKPVRARFFEQDARHNIWISSVGSGVYKLNEQGGVASHLSTETGFIHNDIFAIHPDKKGRVWFGSQGAGLAMLNARDSLVLLSQYGLFPSHDVNDITEDRAGNIWIATDGQGYFKFTENEFENGGTSQNNLTAFIAGIAFNKQDRIWLSYRKGISYLDIKNGKQRDFTAKDGLQNNESYGSKIKVDSKDNILICHESGITILNTRKISSELVLRTYLTGIRISFERPVVVTPSKEQIQTSVFPSTKLPYNQNHLTFDFKATAINYSGAIYYRYFIKEFESAWSPPTTEHSATYSSLNPGTYTLRIQAANNPEKWTDPILEYSFTVQKPYWQRWWFYLLQITGICILFGITYLLSRTQKTKTSILRVMVFTCLFIVFEFIQNWVEPITANRLGQAPIFKTLINLGLALLLLPMERTFRNFFAYYAKSEDLE